MSAWRVGKILTRARGFGDEAWLEQFPLVTIRPEESLEDVVWSWARDNGFKVQDVRVEVLLGG